MLLLHIGRRGKCVISCGVGSQNTRDSPTPRQIKIVLGAFYAKCLGFLARGNWSLCHRYCVIYDYSLFFWRHIPRNHHFFSKTFNYPTTLDRKTMMPVKSSCRKSQNLGTIITLLLYFSLHVWVKFNSLVSCFKSRDFSPFRLYLFVWTLRMAKFYYHWLNFLDLVT